MRPSRSRLLVRRAAAVFVSVVLGGAALAASASVLHKQSLERQLEEQVRAVRATGLIEREERNEDSQLVAARNRLDAVLRDIDSVGITPEGPAFGGPATQRPEWEVKLAVGLEERASLLAELDATLELLRDAPREPSASDRPRPPGSLGKLRSATNLLCGQAWLNARDAQGGSEAGRRLAQALRMLRVTDNGLGIGLAIRVGMERHVVDTLERMRAEGIVAREALDAAVLHELARDDVGGRLRLAVECDLVHAALRVEAGRSPYDETLDALEAMESTLEYLRFARSALDEDLSRRHVSPAVPGATPTAPHHEQVLDRFASLRGMLDDVRARIRCDE